MPSVHLRACNDSRLAAVFICLVDAQNGRIVLSSVHMMPA